MKGVRGRELKRVVDGRRPVQNRRQYGSRCCGSNWIRGYSEPCVVDWYPFDEQLSGGGVALKLAIEYR